MSVAGGGPTTESRFLRSAVAAYGSQLGRTVLRLAADLTLARLVLDVDHGLFDLAFAAVMIASVVRDLGLPYHLVRDERRPFGTVAAWSVGAGLLAAALLAAASPLFAPLDPRLPLVVAALAPFLFLDALAVAPRVWFESRLEVGRLVAPELARGAVLAAVAIALAAGGLGVWAFVAGELAGVAVYAAFLWWRARGRMPTRVELPLLADLLAKSRYLFAVALCAFALPFIERFVVAPFITTAMVAQFNKARYLGQKVQVLLVPAVQRVLYPALVELRAHPERAFGAFRVGTLAILAFEAIVAWFIFFNAGTVVALLFGAQWGPAVPLLRVLAFLPLVNPMSRLGGELLKTRGEDRLWLAIVALDLASLVGFGILLASRHGAMGMAAAEFLLVGNLLMTWRVAAILGRRFWRLAADLAFVYLVPLVPLLPVVLLLAPEEGWRRAAGSAAAAAVAAGLVAWRFQRPFRAWFAGGAAPAGEAG